MKKKQWRKYSCELGESWDIFIDSKLKTPIKDLKCKKGHSAVMEFEYSALDLVSVNIIPCLSIKDPDKKEFNKDKYQLKLELMNGDNWFAFSHQKFTKEEIVKMASSFIGLDKHRAEKIWKLKKLGEFNTYRVDYDEEGTPE